MSWYYPLSAFYSIEILKIEDNPNWATEWVAYRYSNQKRTYRSMVRYDSDDEDGINPYFNTCLGKIYLNECIRC